jgi:hypothetical protein
MTDHATWPDAIVATAKIGKSAVDTACKLADALLGKPLAVAGDMIADEIYVWQTTNRIRLLLKTEEKLKAAGVSARIIPKGFLLPLLDAAGNVDDADLQEMWANLLAGGVTADSKQHPMYIQTLRQMSAADAQLLQVVAKMTGRTPPPDDRGLHVHEGNLSIQRLLTAGLVKRSGYKRFSDKADDIGEMGSGPHVGFVTTALGAAFLQAVAPAANSLLGGGAEGNARRRPARRPK